MSILIICRTCGRELELPDGRNILCCPACSTNNSRPQAQGPTLEKLRRATRLRLAKEYALAEQSYNAVLAEYDNEHEALWGRLLCHYGVEAVQEEGTGRRYLLVHFPRRSMLQESADFRHACELAPPEVRSQYEADADYVDDAQAEIRLIAESCPPYDVFLCHKTTLPGTKSVKTEDYNRAFQLYHALDKQGYNVFFAPLELEGKSGANYEAGIYHALHTARVMLVICSEEAYINSSWVRSEWLRYLEQMAQDDSTPRTLRPLLYGSLQPDALPAEFRRRKLQAIRMESFSARDSLTAVLEQFCGPHTLQAPGRPLPVFSTAAAPGGLCITGYSGPGGQVEIPASIYGQPVVEIGANAFRDNAAILTVRIPEGVTRVASSAFWHCTSLISLQLPASLTNIAHGAFGNCTALCAIALAQGNTRYALRGNTLYTHEGALVCHPAGLPEDSFDVPENTIAVWQNAFAGCSRLLRISLPDSVRFIAQDAFTGCSTLILRVHANTAAHQFAQQHGLGVELLSAPAQPAAAPPPPRKQASPGAAAQVVVLRIKRTSMPNYASRLVCVRVDGRELLQLSNGDSYTLRVSPGTHTIDVKLKPTTCNVNWDARGGLRNIFPTYMQPGREYTVDVANFIRQMS